MVNPFVANTVPVRDVSLMFKEENFNQIAEETKLITLPSRRWNLNQIVCGMKLMLKKSKRTLTRTFSLASNNCQKFICTGLKINFKEFQKCRSFFQWTGMPKYRSTYIWMIKEKNCHVVMLTTTNYSKCAPSSWFGCRYTWNWLSRYLDDESISHNNENRNSLQANSPFKGYQEMSHRRHRSKVKVRAHSNVCLPLEMESMTSLGSQANPLFSKPDSEENSSYIHT